MRSVHRVSIQRAVAAMLVPLGALYAADFELTRSTIDGGGAMRSTGGSFELSGTIGQPDAGVMSNGPFELTGGFWFAVKPGDCNEDGVVGRGDHPALRDCWTGPNATVGIECACFDLDGNGRIDLADFAEFQTNVDGE